MFKLNFVWNHQYQLFGKCFGGGLPIGIIGIKKNIVHKLDKDKKKGFFGGTFSGNSIVTYIANETLNYIIKNKKKFFHNWRKNLLFLRKI